MRLKVYKLVNNILLKGNMSQNFKMGLSSIFMSKTEDFLFFPSLFFYISYTYIKEVLDTQGFLYIAL